jgi:hypothetical protein
MDRVTTELLGRGAKHPNMNRTARPRGGFHDKAAQPLFNAP